MLVQMKKKEKKARKQRRRQKKRKLQKIAKEKAAVATEHNPLLSNSSTLFQVC
jgi:DNA-binding protein H-NS